MIQWELLLDTTPLSKKLILSLSNLVWMNIILWCSLSHLSLPFDGFKHGAELCFVAECALFPRHLIRRILVHANRVSTS